MKKAFTLLLLHVAYLGFSQQKASIKQATALLQVAYKEKSPAQLNAFFAQWRKDFPTITNEEFAKLNDTAKQAYNIFSVFYQPLNLAAIGGSEFGNDIYKNIKYLVVQNEMSIDFTDKVFYSIEEKEEYAINQINSLNMADSIKQGYLTRQNDRLPAVTIARFGPAPSSLISMMSKQKAQAIKLTNFRPAINCADKQPIYLNAAYDTLLNAFLGSKHIPLGAGGIMNPARSAGESQKRQLFLQNYIRIWYGHWGGYWQLYSYPTVRITFDKDMHYARVNYRIVYQGGEAYLKNNGNDNWELLSAKLTWIE